MNMEDCAVYHRADPRVRQKESVSATLDREPMDLPLPNFYYKKASLKRKSCDVQEVEAGEKPESCSPKKACVRPEYPISVSQAAALKSELSWLRHQESLSYMRMRPWPKGDKVWAGRDVTKAQRTATVNWLIGVHKSLHLERNTLFMTVNILDRFIQRGRISSKSLRPLALSCLWIAAKMLENYRNIPREKRLIKLLEPGYTLLNFRACERMILRAIGFNLWRPTALQFAEKYASVFSPEMQAAIRDNLHSALELCLRDMNLSFRKPSEVGIAALSYALGMETDTHAVMLQDISGYDIHSLPKIVMFICNAALRTYKDKTSDPLFEKYPKAFCVDNNTYLHLRVMTASKEKDDVCGE